MGFFDYFNNDLAIDLGTANTLIISKGSRDSKYSLARVSSLYSKRF